MIIEVRVADAPDGGYYDRHILGHAARHYCIQCHLVGANDHIAGRYFTYYLVLLKRGGRKHCRDGITARGNNRESIGETFLVVELDQVCRIVRGGIAVHGG